MADNHLNYFPKNKLLISISKILIVVLCAAALVSCSSSLKNKQMSKNKIPEIPREFRAVWVATVANIDWPSKPGLSTKEQKQELITLLDRAQKLNLNAIILQVRPAADAFYDSSFEPWSKYLTGKQGQAPKPYYDPLKFAIQAAHKRGLELHAWFNPYRVDAGGGGGGGGGGGVPAKDSLVNTHPNWVKSYGSLKWLDPGIAAAQAYTIKVIMDVVKRYDIDGVHLDDYFYPYPKRGKNGKEIPFPDDKSWEKYQQSGGELNRGDWRRSNVNSLIKNLYAKIKQVKPQVKFGISPFGIWKPSHPKQIRGMNQYTRIYADPKTWLTSGWVDYLTPQLYWQLANPNQSFTALLRWWHEQNTKNRHIWPGLYASRTQNGTSSAFGPNEIKYQIQWTRIIQNQVNEQSKKPNKDKQTFGPGEVLFSSKAVLGDDSALGKRLSKTVYKKQALIPASPWLGDTPPKPIKAQITNIADDSITLEANKNSLPTDGWWGWWVVQVKKGKRWVYKIVPGAQTKVTINLPSGDDKLSAVVLFSVNRNGIASTKTPATAQSQNAPSADEK